MGGLRKWYMNKYPRTDFHELNQDWMISMLYDMIDQVENFVTMNAVKYASPIQWDITRQYEKNTIVVDAITGTAYISSRAVPMGVALSRTEYWNVIFDLGRFITLASQNFANSYESVLTTTATMATAKDGWIVWNSLLYRALNDIHVGDMYVVDGNITRYTVEMFFDELATLIADEKQSRIDADDVLQDNIDAEATARENADDTLQDNINAEATAREDADGVLQDNIDAEASARDTADDALQDNIDATNAKIDKYIDTFTSAYAANTVDFAAELYADALPKGVGSYIYNCVANGHRWSAIVNVNTAAQGSIFLNTYTTATDEGYISAWTLNANGWAYNAFVTDTDLYRNVGIIGTFYAGKSILILGDSLATASRVWVQKFTAFVTNLGATVTNYATSGWTTQQILNDLQNRTPTNYDLCILWSGTNDWNSHVMPGNTFGIVSGTYGYYLQQILELLGSSFGDPEILLLSIPFSVRPNVSGKKLARREWNRMCYAMAIRYGACYLDLFKAPLIGTSKDPSIWMVASGGDYNHFNDWYQDTYLWQFILKSFATKNDGLVGIDTVYTVSNMLYPILTDLNESCELYRVHMTVNDNGFGNLTLILNSTADIVPNGGIIVIGTWNLDVFNNEDCIIQLLDTNDKKVYQGVLVHGPAGLLRIYTSDTIPSGHTLFINAQNFRTSLSPYYLPSNL